jgi:long-subunit acyl-CoA synthetase (AMP-forming)
METSLIKEANIIVNKVNKQKNSYPRILISGSNQELYAELARIFIRLKYQTILISQDNLLAEDSELIVQESSVSIYGLKTNDQSTTEDWVLGLYTSGSTGKPKLFGFSEEKIKLTLSWYQKVYKANSDTIIITMLPSSYNFSFIAGVLLSDYVKCKYLYIDNSEVLLKKIEKYIFDGKHVILLANPIIMDIISTNLMKYNLNGLFVDSGGASMSKLGLQWFRDRGIDIREGWGVTETCSLTHFDSEGNEAAIGTVGKNMPGVKTKIIIKNGVPCVYVKSPNTGIQLSASGAVNNNNDDYIMSGDIGKIDPFQRLIILGKSTDMAINGYWPRDTLEAIGSILGPRTATVLYLNSKEVIIFLYQNLLDEEIIKIKHIVHEKLDIDLNKVVVKNNYRELLTSMKTNRNYTK